MTPKTWAKASAIISRTLERSNTGDTLADVKDALTDGSAQLWLTDITAVVTNIEGQNLNVWLYGGSLRDMPALFNSAKAWALKLNLKNMTVTRARRGWSRALIPLGFTQSGDGCLICDLEA